MEGLLAMTDRSPRTPPALPITMLIPSDVVETINEYLNNDGYNDIGRLNLASCVGERIIAMYERGLHEPAD
jgi:hypothetical protein